MLEDEAETSAFRAFSSSSSLSRQTPVWLRSYSRGCAGGASGGCTLSACSASLAAGTLAARTGRLREKSNWAELPTRFPHCIQLPAESNQYIAAVCPLPPVIAEPAPSAGQCASTSDPNSQWNHTSESSGALAQD